MKTNKPLCTYCRKELLGRADQRFCDYSCRGAHHNEKRRQKDGEVRKVNAILKANRKILQTLFDQEQFSLSDQLLMGLGYNKQFNTGVYVDRFSVCYDIGLQECDGQMNHLVLVKNGIG